MVKALLCCLATLALAGAVEVGLELPEQVVPGVVLEGAVVISDTTCDITAIELPPVSGLAWQVINSKKTTIANGRATIRQGIALRAAALGVLELPPVTVRLADGSSASSAPRQLQVTSGDPTLVGDAVASVRFDPPSIVPGQPTSLVYRLCLQRGSVSKLDIGPPEGAISLGERTVAEGRTLDARGHAWTVVTVTWPITHATPGSYAVGGQQEIQIQLGDGMFDTRVKRRQIAVPPATLTVEALPAAGRPDDFSGLIGPFTASAALERERVAAGEGTVLSVTVRGRQTGLARRPPLRLQGAQCYAKDDSGDETSRTFRWDIVPGTPGAIAIPPLHFPFFDPGSRSYRSADTEALTLTVLPGRNRDLGIVGAAPATAATPVATAPAGPVMPAPLRGSAVARPAIWLGAAALGGGLAGGLGIALLRRITLRRAPHRGRLLRQAGRDPAALATALAALRPALRTPEQRAAAAALQDALDSHRFGGRPMPDPHGWILALEDVA